MSSSVRCVSSQGRLQAPGVCLLPHLQPGCCWGPPAKGLLGTSLGPGLPGISRVELTLLWPPGWWHWVCWPSRQRFRGDCWGCRGCLLPAYFLHAHPSPQTVPRARGWECTTSTLFFHLFTDIVGFPGGSVGKESTCNAGDLGLISGLGRSTGEGIGYPLQYSWASLVAQLVKNPPAMWETWVWSLGWEDPQRRERPPTPVFWPGEF